MKDAPPKTAPSRLYRSETNESKTLYRSTQNKMIAGVAGGLGEYFDIDPTIIRIIFIILALFQGSGLLIYIVMWIILPTKAGGTSTNENTVKDNIKDIKSRAQTFAHSINLGKKTGADDSRFWWAVLIIALGFFFLFRNFGIFDALDLEKFWPVILIGLGLLFILRR